MGKKNFLVSADTAHNLEIFLKYKLVQNYKISENLDAFGARFRCCET